MDQKDKLLLTEKEAAELLSMSWHYLRRDRIAPNPASIPFIRIGSAIRYRRADLEQWIEQQASKPAQPRIARPPIELPTGKRRRGRPTKAEQIAARRAAEKIDVVTDSSVPIHSDVG